MPRPNVSVAMGAYNGEKYIARQLKSILAQTRPPDEIIVCDDNSADDTVAIIANLAEVADVPIRISANEANLGYRKNFEKALAQTTGDIIFYSDQDDIWLAHKIQRVLEHFESHPEALLVYTDGTAFDEATGEQALLSNWYGGYFRGELRAEQAFKNRYRTHNVKGCLMAFRSELKAFALPFGEGWGHDRWLTLIGYALSSVAYLDEPLILHRRHSETVTKGDFFGTEQQVAQKRPRRRAALEALLRGQGKRKLPPNRYRSLLERLKEARTSGLASKAQRPVLESYIHECQQLSDIYEARWSLKERNPVSALWMATGLLVSGFYHRNFAGFLSYADDVLNRPRARVTKEAFPRRAR